MKRTGWRWIVMHGLLALAIMIALRLRKGAELASADALGWTLAAALLLAAATAALGLAAALCVRVARWQPGTATAMRYAATIALTLLGAVMLIQA
jgi:hypothetical protein